MNSVRVFRGTSTKEVMRVIRKELGENAVVLSSATISKPRGEKLIEIKASAIQEEPQVLRQTQAADQALLRALITNGVQEPLARKLQALALDYPAQNKNDTCRSLAAAISRTIRLRKPGERSRVLALIGPTGAGKTTTAAKLAVRDLVKGAQVGLITVDNHSLGGRAALQSFAALAGLPVVSARSASELEQRLLDFADKDRIYIDTVGSGARNEERLAELAGVLRGAPEIEKMIILPASGNSVDLKRLISAYAKFGLHSASISKLDETFYFGPCFSSVAASGLPLAFFGTGPEVPEDLEFASAQRLARLLGEVRH